jgi:hypothetical protein
VASNIKQRKGKVARARGKNHQPLNAGPASTLQFTGGPAVGDLSDDIISSVEDALKAAATTKTAVIQWIRSVVKKKPAAAKLFAFEDEFTDFIMDLASFENVGKPADSDGSISNSIVGYEAQSETIIDENLVSDAKDGLELIRNRTLQMLAEVGLDPEQQAELVAQITSLVGKQLSGERDKTSGQAKEIALPEKAPELYKDRPRDPETGRLETVAVYLERVWKPWIDAGVLTRPDFRRLDPEGEMALRNWLRNPENKLPDDLHIPKKTEVLSREVAEIDAETVRAVHRLVSAQQRRRKQEITH